MYRYLLASLLIFCTAQAGIKYLPGDRSTFFSTGVCIGCDLSRADLVTDGFVALNLTGSILIGSTLSSLSFHRGERHQGSNMSSVIAIQLAARNVDFSGSNFTSANLRDADLSYTNLSKVNFSQAILDGANLYHANLYGSNITKIQLESASSVCNAILPSGLYGSCS